VSISEYLRKSVRKGNSTYLSFDLGSRRIVAAIERRELNDVNSTTASRRPPLRFGSPARGAPPRVQNQRCTGRSTCLSGKRASALIGRAKLSRTGRHLFERAASARYFAHNGESNKVASVTKASAQ